MRETTGTGPAGGPKAPDAGPGGGPCAVCRPADARSAVRRAVAERCRGCAAPDALEDALLVTSELTTNAILHGGGITGFAVAVDSAGVRVSVSDRSDDGPPTGTPAGPDTSRLGGRGWPIVCSLARDVSVAGLPSGGKRITALVPLR